MQAYDLFTVRQMMSKENIIFAHIDEIIPTKFVPFRSSGKLLNKKLKKVEINYYMTDAISRASVTMARCARMQLQNEATI